MDDNLFQEYLDYLDFAAETKVGYYNGSPIADDELWISGSTLETHLPQLKSASEVLTAASTPLSNDASLFLIGITGNAKYTPLSMTKDHFTTLLTTCHLPKRFVQSAFNNNGHFAHFLEYSSSPSPSPLTPIPNPAPTFLSLTLQTPHSPLGTISLTLRTRLSDRSTTCLLIDSDPSRLPTLISRLRGRHSLIQSNTLYILTLLAEEYSFRNERWRENLDLSIVDMEKHIGATGFPRDDILLSSSMSSGEEKQEPESLIQDLHIAHTSLIWLDCTMNFEQELVAFGTEMVALCEELRGGVGRVMGVEEKERLESEAGWVGNACRFRRYQGVGLRLRVETQINILYSQISQRDSRINVSVAKDSRRLAAAARKDSRTMKTIAVLTLFFLPATLVASIYSTGIFPVEEGASKVSDVWWTYVVSSLGLTCLVLSIWVFYMFHTRDKVVDYDDEKLA